MDFWQLNGCIFALYTIMCILLRKANAFLVLSFLHLTIIAAFRDITVGDDTLNYCRIYLRIAKGGFSGSAQIPARSLLSFYYRIASIFFKRANGYMISTSVPTMAAFFYIIKKYSSNYYLSVYFFVSSFLFFYTMNAGRQFIAVALILLSFHQWNDGRKLASIAFYIAAILVHNSAIVFGIYFFMGLVRWNLLRVAVYSIITIILMGSIGTFIRLYIILFPRYEWMIRSSFIYEWSSRGRLSFIHAAVTLSTVVMSLFIIALNDGVLRIKHKGEAVLPRKQINEETKQLYYRLTLLLITSTAINIFYPRVVLFTRISYYLFVFVVLLLPNVLHNNKLLKNTITIVFVCGFAAIMIYQLYGGYSGVVNYHFYGAAGWL